IRDFHVTGVQTCALPICSKTDVKTHICTVRFAEWERNGDVLKFTIIADRFLRNMVRAIVGTLVNVGKERISISKFKFIIAQKERSEERRVGKEYRYRWWM